MTKTGSPGTQATFTRDRFVKFLCAENGMSIVEYAIAAGLIAAAIAGSFGVLGTTINALIVTITAAL